MQANDKQVTIPALQQMKRDGQKIMAVVAWDVQMARIAERAGVDMLVVGDSVGVNVWGHANPLEITLDEMIIVSRAVRRGARRALVCADMPFGSLQRGVQSAVEAGIRLVKEAAADMIKLDGAADYPEAVGALVKAGIPVMAQFGITPQTALKYGIQYNNANGALVSDAMVAQLVKDAKIMEAAGASMIDFTNSGPVAGEAVCKAVDIPVIGGFGGGPWLDGRVRMAHAAIGYGAANIDAELEQYANVARTTLDAFTELFADVRAGKQIKGTPKAKAAV
ncbi:3-methyl-2-oxobutanoate hydroxymethyltransferase [Paraburkholderia tagetis]|uniref:3-methyl-2-oxobutanoate hydroxymethyltransferase n=1 Tax=Paraburkholderia tagetis TaxID=2913261 RepID=A0A9X1UFQ9_9BURK|nr:3-methyl-2-oxobutanoate hydroxymethyltransferase [Paraburkholderia tagetis]MCG5074859.1 3-methyl-2-oxobutanoate hydroxymethyltransferase [Paraburkholderia tagetis]